jgi:hypothetical protein
MADLVTLPEVKAALNLGDTDESHDDELELWIEAATAHVAGRSDELPAALWTVIDATAPADLKLAALEDIRGLYQPGQIGPPAEFGAFGIDSVDVGTTYRPVRMWPRLDAWVESRRLAGFA